LVVLLLIAAAPAMSKANSTDPPSGSPAGAIYQLPVDTGRQDAAPRPDGDGAGSGLPDSTFRSDNNFGTSSTVPGDPRAGENPGGSGDAQGGGSDSATPVVQAAGDNGDPSEPRTYLLLAVIVGVGAFMGLAGSRSARNNS
jgi:hypothetical protein